MFDAAGLVTVGRTNTSELGLLPTTEPLSYGPTRIPGSLRARRSGPEVAPRRRLLLALFRLLTATMGVGRLSGFRLRVIGLKPTRGRVSLGPDFGDLVSGTISEFAITSSVRDTAALLAAVSVPQVGNRMRPPVQRASLRVRYR